jgi:hypothetical protein
MCAEMFGGFPLLSFITVSLIVTAYLLDDFCLSKNNQFLSYVPSKTEFLQYSTGELTFVCL